MMMMMGTEHSIFATSGSYSERIVWLMEFHADVDIWGHGVALCGLSTFPKLNSPANQSWAHVNMCETTEGGITIWFDGWARPFQWMPLSSTSSSSGIVLVNKSS